MGKFNKVIASVVTLALVATLAVGVSFGTKTKAEAVNVITNNWTNFKDAYEENDADIENSVIESTADQISADITMTGWSANWWKTDDPWDKVNTISLPNPDNITIDSFWGDNPFQLRSENYASIVPGTTYTLSFTIDNKMTEKGTFNTNKVEKNVTVSVNSGIKGDNVNSFLNETVKVGPGEVKPFTFDVTIDPAYEKDEVKITFAYGTYSASYGVTKLVAEGTRTDEQAKADPTLYAYPTTEPNNAKGKLTISNISMMGEAGVVKTTKAPETTKASEVTTAGSSEVTTAPTEVTTAKKLAQVKNVKAKNNKKGKVTVTWKKVANAKNYQVKVGTKKATVSKVKYVAKVKKGKTVKVQVRALAANGYKAGAWSKVVKVKVKK